MYDKVAEQLHNHAADLPLLFLHIQEAGFLMIQPFCISHVYGSYQFPLCILSLYFGVCEL